MTTTVHEEAHERHGPGEDFLPGDPFTANRFHFGMLLGVDDLETEQGYHRGKMRLHNAWLHREGTVWGLGVEIDTERNDGEIAVAPGLALDAAGHELHADARACVNVGKWFDAQHDRSFATEGDARAEFDAHVVARFRTCLTRQVPALMDPCEGGGAETAYSRVFETLELLLVPGPAPERVVPYHRLRLLFGLEPAREKDGAVVDDDQAVLDARAEVLAKAADDQPLAYLEALRRFAPLDAIQMSPAVAPEGGQVARHPALEDEPLVLADVRGIVLEGERGAWKLTAGEIDNGVRQAHVATATIQELLCGPVLGAAAAAAEGGGGGGGGPGAPADAGGPRGLPETVAIDNRTITFQVNKPLHPGSLGSEGFRVSAFDAGWEHYKVRDADFDAASSTVKLTLRAAPGGDLLRLVALGTGTAPVLGTDLVPLAGAVGGPPGTRDRGNDFVRMLMRSES